MSRKDLDSHEKLHRRKSIRYLPMLRRALFILLQLVQEIVIAILIGLAAGGVGTLFYHCMSFVTTTRGNYPWLLYLLPFAGLVIIFLYHICGEDNNSGTNLIIDAVQEDVNVPFHIAPLMFVSTLITHLFGGSAGREGAALQIGGSIGGSLGRLFHVDHEMEEVFILCGMSACFSAVFGTPLAAAIFSLEVVSVGLMHYSALVPAVISSFTAHVVAKQFRAYSTFYAIPQVPDFGPVSGLKIILAGILIAIVSVIFVIALHFAEGCFKKYFPNPYLRIFAGGCMIIALTFIFQTRDYLGAGVSVIEACFSVGVPWYAFLLKILFTGITLGSGFKGGEIVPAFFTGATAGYMIGMLLHLPAPLAAACGMVGVFCGATNSPITSLLMAFELFGIGGLPYFVITVAISYMLSGYYGLYHSQRIIYSKYRPMRRVNKHSH